VCTDYPDATILEPIARNRDINLTPAQVKRFVLKGYMWGHNPEELLEVTKSESEHELAEPKSGQRRYDRILMCDLLWFYDEHRNLLQTCQVCLADSGRITVTVGDYTKP
jgi:nicotinamide N-methyltransferase